MNLDKEVIISNDNPALIKKQNKCISCGYCKRVCDNEITVSKLYDINICKSPICIHCGACSNMCPTEAIRERYDYQMC